MFSQVFVDEKDRDVLRFLWYPHNASTKCQLITGWERTFSEQTLLLVARCLLLKWRPKKMWWMPILELQKSWVKID